MCCHLLEKVYIFYSYSGRLVSPEALVTLCTPLICGVEEDHFSPKSKLLSNVLDYRARLFDEVRPWIPLLVFDSALFPPPQQRTESLDWPVCGNLFQDSLLPDPLNS